jgi:hypothetical protein
MGPIIGLFLLEGENDKDLEILKLGACIPPFEERDPNELVAL